MSEYNFIEYLYHNYKTVSKGKKSFEEFKNYLTLIDFEVLERYEDLINDIQNLISFDFLDKEEDNE